MRTESVVLMLILVGIPAASVMADQLLVPVGSDRLREVENRNDYFLRRDGYFARRRQIVELVPQSLFGPSDVLTIPLFDGESVTYQKADLSFDRVGGSYVWRGVLANPPMSKEAFVAQMEGIDREEARRLFDLTFGIEIHGTRYLVDPETGDSEDTVGWIQDPETGALRNLSDGIANADQNKVIAFSAHSNFTLYGESGGRGSAESAIGRSYQLRSLPMDRRFSAVYEVDPSKTILMSDDPASLRSSDRQKIRDYKLFMDQLGPDPRFSASSQPNSGERQ